MSAPEEQDPRVYCTCGRHLYEWRNSKWYRMTGTGLRPCDVTLPCMKDRGPEYREKKIGG